MARGKLVILNGTTSAGKSSTQQALTALADEPWLAAGVDHFWRFIFGKYNGLSAPADQGFHWIGRFDGDTLHVEDVRIGDVGWRFFTGMHHAIRAFLDAGLNVVADHCLWDQRLVDEVAEVFGGYDVWLVHLGPPLEVSERWERERKDKKMFGMSRAVQRRIDTTDVTYDLTLDTSTMTPQTAAEALLALVGRGEPRALASIRALDSSTNASGR